MNKISTTSLSSKRFNQLLLYYLSILIKEKKENNSSFLNDLLRVDFCFGKTKNMDNF